jgi:hypothetical protein
MAKETTSRAPTAAEGIRARRGLASMLAEQGGDQETVDAAELIESMPGGPELLYSFAAQQLLKKAGVKSSETQKVKLYEIGGYVEKAEGGLAEAAETTRKGGRNGDSMMVHMTPEELGVLEGMWGKADINPNTGMPEYGFFSKIWKSVKKAVKKVFSSKIFQIVAPIALSMFAPGLGTWVGSLIPGVTGAGQAIVGNALLRGGMSAAGGGDFMSGAMTGAIAGGLGDVAGGWVKEIAPGLSDSTAAIVGSSLASGAGSELTGGDFVEGAMSGALTQMMQPTVENLAGKGQEMFGLEAPPEGGILAQKASPETMMAREAAKQGTEGALAQANVSLDEGLAPGEMGPPAPPPPGYGEPGTTMSGPPEAPIVTPAGGTPAPGTAPPPGGMDTLMKYGMPLLMGASAMSGDYEEGQPPQMDPGMLEDLPIYDSNRQWIGPNDPNAYYRYGQQGAPQSGEQLFVTPDPFSGETGTPTVGPTGGLGAQDQIAALMQQGQPVPANMVRGNGGRLRAAGYNLDPNTGTWMPPPPQLGQGTGFSMGGAADYFSQNADVPSAIPTVSASGGYTQGPGTGRSDDIPARLSDGEYVIDAETVALLGDGSGKAGAQRLDEMRQNMRKHKAKNLSKGGFSHKARSPENYMPRLRAAAGRA